MLKRLLGFEQAGIRFVNDIVKFTADGFLLVNPFLFPEKKRVEKGNGLKKYTMLSLFII